MDDHNYITESGESIPTAKLPTAKIIELLQDGITVQDTAQPDAVFWVRMRLEIELLIRRLGL